MSSFAVVTPSRGLVHSRTVAAVMSNVAAAGHEFRGWFLTHDLPIPECHERAAELGLATGADAIWFVEEDVIPPPGSLAAAFAQLRAGYSMAAVDYPVSGTVGCLSRDRKGAILWVGLGATLVSRAAFEAVKRPWFQTTRGFGGQDIHFCHEVLAAGLRIGQVPRLVAGHAKVDAEGIRHTNIGYHTVTVLDRITRQYTEPPAPPRLRLHPPRTVVLVPRRADGGERDRLWEFCRAWWARTFDVPVFEGVHAKSEGLFNRSMAINRAARAAGEWQVAVIVDADTIPDPTVLCQGTRRAFETDRMIAPFNNRRELTAPETERVLHGAPLDDRAGGHHAETISGILAISRTLWDKVGGFDEGYQGWGWEDNAFADACERAGGNIIPLQGPLWHLYHAPSPETNQRSPSFRANKRRFDEQHSPRTQDQVRARREERMRQRAARIAERHQRRRTDWLTGT